MEQLLKNKTILITWASGDIWLQTAIDCYDYWANLLLFSYKNENRILEKFRGLDETRIKVFSCNATSEDEVNEIFENFKHLKIKIDGIFLSAGDLIDRCHFIDLNWDFIQKVIDINIKSSYLFLKNALPFLNNNSSIVTMSSMTARWWKWDRSSHYWLAKSAILGFTKSLANELPKQFNIRINSIAPWYIKWQFHDKFTKKEVEIEHAELNPLKRVWTPKDVSWVVVFLLSNLSSYVNWTTIDINWGSFIT